MLELISKDIPYRKRYINFEDNTRNAISERFGDITKVKYTIKLAEEDLFYRFEAAISRKILKAESEPSTPIAGNTKIWYNYHIKQTEPEGKPNG